ncbi:capsid protein [Vingilotevirus gimli]|uniref:Capsid protein n=1 Tax=Giardia-associated CRESS DNA virus 2 TaxID=2766566 RepID=A0AAE7JCF8_9VIRU|nr:capsid protein [Giardia-associated CRESS DNA virus 2]QNJ47549.1 capsid protein [Giardia-associated CRESS DNA virus 2]
MRCRNLHPCAPRKKMAWTYRSRRYSSRTVRRSFRRRRVAGSRYRRRYRRGRRYRKTTSAYVTLTQNAQWILFTESGGVRRWNVFTFTPATVPGFMDYQATYSHFRILKCKLFMARSIAGNVGTSFNYLTVGSRPFAAVQPPGFENSGPSTLVPAQLETDLRQAKWQKIRNPPTTSLVVPIGFHPYTIIQTHGPATIGISNRLWQRTWEAKRWMPFTWAQAPSGATNPPGGIAFYGPYVVVDAADGDVPGAFSGQAVECTLRITVQFRGQR